MSTIKDIIALRKQSDDKQEPKHIISHGTTIGVDYADNPQVLGRPGFVWVRENDQAGGVFQVFNPSVKLSVGLPVIISRESGASSRRTIKSVNWSALADSMSTSSTALSIPNHHRDHEWPTMLPGLDPINIYSRAMAMLKIYPGSSAVTLSVAPGYYMLDKDTIYFSGLIDDDISSHVPSTVGNSVSVLVYVDIVTNLVAYLDGTESALIFPVEPDITSGVIPLGYVRLAHGVGLLTESNITNDPRPFISISTGVILIATINGINAKTVAITTLYTVPIGKVFIPDHIVIRVTAFTVGAKSVQAIASFGGNSATYDDYLNSVTYTVAAVSKFIKDAAVMAASFPIYAAGALFKLSIETGSNATLETWSVDVFGYLK